MDKLKWTKIQIPLYIQRYGGRLFWILSFPEGFLRTGKYSNKIPRTDRHDTGTQTPGMARKIIILIKRNMEYLEA